MAINGIIFNNQKVPAAAMAEAFSALLPDGILKGCTLGYAGRNFTVAPGMIIAAGRLIQLTTTQTIAVGTAQGTRSIVLKIDLNATATTTEFNQVSIRSVSGAYTPVQEDINGGTGTTYEIVLAVIEVGSTAITGITSRIGSARRVIYESTTQPTNWKDGELWAKLPAGSGG